ncbi:MAG: DUF5916 domain-containing protein [Candidatus Aminicenantales bacterium]
MKRLLYFILPSLFILSSPVFAVELKAVRVIEGPKIDGHLSDSVWQSAVPFVDFRMVEPQPNQNPTEKTELRILYDDSNLYIGVLCHDREPARIAANSMAHDNGGDEGGWGRHQQRPIDDLIRVLLDPFQDRRTAYIFFVNPRGARGEGLASGGESSLNWDGIWEAKSRIFESGWSAELRIPFKTISFKPGLTAWGINVERTIARKQETIRLSGTNRDSIFNNPMEAASLEGIEGVKQGMGITFRPYGIINPQKSDFEHGGYDWKLDGGFDIYKNFTPNLVGAFSYRMDFAETEADERRINLTRFPLFFPEKRMFFLEGSEVFNFSSSISFVPFFSRRIGLYEGQPVPVIFGAKLYGKIGRTNLAVLDVQTDQFEGLPGSNFFAARMTQDIFFESKVGWIFTNGSPTGEKNSLLGLDFAYSTSKFTGDKNLFLAAWMAYNWNEQKQGRHHGFGFRANYPNDLLDIQTTYAYYGEALDPGLGYMMRHGIQTFYARLSYQPRPEKGFLGRLVRQFFFEASGDFYWDLSGRLETSKLTASPLNLRTESGEQIEFNIVPNRDVLPYDFEVAKGVILPARAYDFINYRLSFNTATHRPAAFDLNYTFGEFYSGRYDDLSLGVTLKYKGMVSLALDANFVRGRLPEGNFRENVYQVKADIFLSPDLGLMNYIQYDDVSRQLGWSSRLRWQISPGNEIFIVYNKNWERRWDPARRFFPMEERGVLKISLSIRP